MPRLPPAYDIATPPPLSVSLDDATVAAADAALSADTAARVILRLQRTT